MRFITEFVDELRSDVREITSSKGWQRVQSGSIAVGNWLNQFIINWLGKLFSSKFNLVCTALGTMIVVSMVFLSMPVWVKCVLSALLIGVSSAGRSFLDWKYLNLENELEMRMIHTLRLQATLAIPDKAEVKESDPESPENIIIQIALNYGMRLKFIKTERSSQGNRYLFHVGKLTSKIDKELPLALKSAFQLASPAVITVSGETMTITFFKK